ncbi:hypothetical protein D3C81_2158870 [compost metagenome]
MFNPVFILNISPDRWMDEPLPEDAKVMPMGVSLANLMYSGRLCTGRLGLTTSKLGILAMSPMGSKSLTG